MNLPLVNYLISIQGTLFVAKADIMLLIMKLSENSKKFTALPLENLGIPQGTLWLYWKAVTLRFMMLISKKSVKGMCNKANLLAMFSKITLSIGFV